MYEILGKLFAAVIMLGAPLVIGILLGRYSSKFNSWEEFKEDFFD
ncbi:hypothetical protein OXT66_08055 [Lentilactobacillus senioris]|nr:hypothetical protein [Lentilactobacillus senioris]MCY9807486.1 hypothetical protein [Lentilactobacillus senioris]